MSEPRYPDISDILNRKAQGRLDLSRRSFGAKIEAIEALRERLRPFAERRAKGYDASQTIADAPEGAGQPTVARGEAGIQAGVPPGSAHRTRPEGGSVPTSRQRSFEPDEGRK